MFIENFFFDTRYAYTMVHDLRIQTINLSSSFSKISLSQRTEGSKNLNIESSSLLYGLHCHMLNMQ